jgi:hypothetical protein
MNRFALSLLLLAASGSSAIAASTCQASSSTTALNIVELYTSEGCSSCPPADRWLSTLKGRPDVLALAFHVNYWDHLGWVDRFATAQATERQYELARLSGRSGVYTPQVVVNGQDERHWPQLPKPASTSPVSASLTRDGDVVTVQVAAATASSGQLPARLAGYWAVLEDGHHSKVKAGENAGETLDHDHVVRLYRPVSPWSSAAGQQQQLTVTRGAAEFPRRVVFVITDATTARPLQAVTLGC